MVFVSLDEQIGETWKQHYYSGTTDVIVDLIPDKRTKREICECGRKNKTKTDLCSVCSKIKREKEVWKDYDLAALYNKCGSILGISKLIGISDNGIRKRMKKLGIWPEK